MLAYIKQFINSLNKTKIYLILANALLVFFLILLNNLKVIPLKTGDFIFFSLLTLAFALYRPGWAFLFFVGTVTLENINLAPDSLGIAVRPYQFFGALTVLAILFRLISRKLYFKLVKPEWYDWLIVVMALAGFLSVLGASDKNVSFKFSIIFASFAVLYFLVKNYIQNSEDLKRVAPFFLSSGVIVVLYGVWQNIRFLRGLSHFEVMPGRPNSVFTEPDWLGMFIIVLISSIYGLLYYFQNQEDCRDELKMQDSKCKITIQNAKSFFLYAYLVLSFVLLVVTVSRSAWLGALAVTFIYLFVIFTQLRFNPKNWQWKRTIRTKLSILLSFLVALGAVYVFHLTDFQLFNRVQSAGTGLQKITISCDNSGATNRIPVDMIINYVTELEEYGCRHINLEDIERERLSGNEILEIYRKDPNVSVRGEIYRKSWEEVKKHPLLGIGWGNIGKILGSDERGTILNSSNIFLEIWLGSGIVGILCFVILVLYALFSAVRNYFYAQDFLQKAIGLFIISSWFGIVVFNLFNAGTFLALLWVYLGIATVRTEK